MYTRIFNILTYLKFGLKLLLESIANLTIQNIYNMESSLSTLLQVKLENA